MDNCNTIILTPIDGEPRIRDIDLAKRLGFERPADIRELIKRNAEKLNTFSVLRSVRKTSGAQGGRPAVEFYLDRKQAIFICMKSETDNAFDVQIEIVHVFDAYLSDTTTQQHITSALPYSPAFEIQIAESAARILRMSDTSKIRMLTTLCDAKGINPNFLPAYVDEPLVKAITTLLKEMDHPLGHHVAKVVNPTLEKLGILEHLSRKGRGNEIKQFWNLTAEGLQYGRNETSPNNPRETQPLFFVDRFPELLQRLETFITEHTLLSTNPQ